MYVKGSPSFQGGERGCVFADVILLGSREVHLDFRVGSVGKEPACKCKRCGFNPWVGKISWRRAWKPTPVFLLGESHGQRSLAGCSPWGCRELDTTEATEVLLEREEKRVCYDWCPYKNGTFRGISWRYKGWESAFRGRLMPCIVSKRKRKKKYQNFGKFVSLRA